MSKVGNDTSPVLKRRLLGNVTIISLQFAEQINNFWKELRREKGRKKGIPLLNEVQTEMFSKA
jgi:hypothetical protein